MKILILPAMYVPPLPDLLAQLGITFGLAFIALYLIARRRHAILRLTITLAVGGVLGFAAAFLYAYMPAIENSDSVSEIWEMMTTTELSHLRWTWVEAQLATVMGMLASWLFLEILGGPTTNSATPGPAKSASSNADLSTAPPR